MKSVFHIGVESARISFPSVPRGAQLSVREMEEIESALAQMEIWNALGSVALLKEGPGSKEQDEAKVEKGPLPVAREEGGANDHAPEIAPIEDGLDIPIGRCGGCCTAEGHSPPTAGALEAPGKHQDSEVRRQGEEYSCFEHVRLQGIDPYLNLRRPFTVFMDAPPQPQDASPKCTSVRQPLRRVRGKDPERKKDASKPRQRITPEKENALPSRFKVRRKPAPHFSETPSNPLEKSRTGKQSSVSQFRKQIESFPKLDGGDHVVLTDPSPRNLQEPLRTVCIHNFTLKKLLGAGAQGRVYLAQGPLDRGRRGAFAIKVMIKNRYAYYDTIAREQKLLKRIRGHKFLLHLEGSFHDKKNFYLVTQYHPGRDLDDLLRKQGRFDTSATRFYAAELSSALVFLHQNHILHRDVKLSNILIKEDGHLCLSDFGLGADFTDQVVDDNEDSFMADAEPVVRGFAGTTVYMAPEVLNNEYYSYKIDWWSSGVTLYSLLEGQFPWSCFERQWLAEHAGIESPRFRVVTDTHAKSFVRALLQRDPDRRIGDIDVFSHPFFNDIKIQDIDQGKLKPPYVPEPADYDNLPNGLTRRDYIDIGLEYPPGEIPMASYFFYGSTLPEYEPSKPRAEIDILPSEELTPPLSCSRSLFELLQESEADSSDATLRNLEPASISDSPSPFRVNYALAAHDASEATIVEEPRTDHLLHGLTSANGLPQPAFFVEADDPAIPSGAEQTPSEETGGQVAILNPCSETRLPTGIEIKDSRVRWSMLTVEEGQFDDAVIPEISSAVIERRNSVNLGQVLPIGLNPGSDLDSEAVRPMTRLDTKRWGIICQTPSTPGVSVFVTPPREDREVSAGATGSEMNNTDLSPDDSPASGRDNSTFETAALLWFGTDMNDETAVTTVDLGSSGSNTSSGPEPGSAFFGSGLGSDLASPTVLEVSMNKPLPPVPGPLASPYPYTVDSAEFKNQVVRWFKNVSKALVKDVKRAGGSLWKRVMEA